MVKPRVLICPLDWGLGHASRCVPIIHALIRKDCEVSIAGCGPSLELLRSEFPNLPVHTIASYQIRYSNTLPVTVALAMRLPRMLAAIQREHAHVKEIVERERINFIISDNRYGCWSESTHNAIITHQLSLQMPNGWEWFSSMVNRRLSKWILKFDECWIPDLPDRALSGDLSVPFDAAIQPKFVGVLSRIQPASVSKRKCKLLIVVSGPEPQRTLFETMTIDQAKRLNVDYRMVRGLPGGTAASELKIANHLTTHQFSEWLHESDIVLSRPGYSTVMDISTAGKKAIFVPTPGQTEQLYLARRFEAMNMAAIQYQDRFDLDSALQQVESTQAFVPPQQESWLESTLEEFLKQK